MGKGGLSKGGREGGEEGTKLSPISWRSYFAEVNRAGFCYTEVRYNNYYNKPEPLNPSTGAVVLASGREIAWRVVQSIVETLAKTMDAMLFSQQLQVAFVDYVISIDKIGHKNDLPRIIVGGITEKLLACFKEFSRFSKQALVFRLWYARVPLRMQDYHLQLANPVILAQNVCELSFFSKFFFTRKTQIYPRETQPCLVFCYRGVKDSFLKGCNPLAQNIALIICIKPTISHGFVSLMLFFFCIIL